jgi:ABC-type glycerol-3-phosphate transport system substrate-binding protein
MVQRESRSQQALGNRLSRRQFLAAAAATATVAMLAACAPATPPAPTAAPAAKGSGADPAPKKAPASSEPITIKFWHQESDPKSVKAVEDMAAQFKASHPNVTVEPTVLGWADMETKLVAAHAAGAPPELVDGFNQGMAWAVGRGLVRPLDDVYEHVKAATGWQETFIDWARWDGHVWGLQWTWGTDMLLIRKDLSDQAGLKEPTTWDEWLEWAKALTIPNERYGIHLAGNAALWFNEDVFEFVGGNGGKLWDADGMPALVSDEMNDVLEYYKRLTAVMPPGWLADGYVETMNTMALGQAASARLWGRTIGYLSQYAPADKQNADVYKMIPMPLGPKGKVRVTQSMDDTLVIYQNSAHPEVAAEFLKEVVFKRENIRDFCLTVPVHLNPPINGVVDDPVYKENALVKKWANWIDVQHKNLADKAARPLFILEESDKKVPWLTDIANAGIMGETVTAVVSKGVSPQDAMKAGQEKATSIAMSAKNAVKKA